VNCNQAGITQNTVNLWWCLSYASSQVRGILFDACLITVHMFTVFCVMFVLLQFTSSRYSVWCLPYYSSYVHGILRNAFLMTFHKFTVFCVKFALLQIISSWYSVWCLSYYSSQVHGILWEYRELVNCNKASVTQNTVNLWTVIRQTAHRIPWTCEL
jgi:hypothetical protein